MRLFEIESTSGGYTNFLTLLNFLRQRAHAEGLVGRITFSAMQNMLSNLGTSIDYASFKEYYDDEESYPGLRNVIKNFDQDSITLQPYGDEEDQVNQTNTANSDEPSLNKVDTMAKRALRKRS